MSGDLFERNTIMLRAEKIACFIPVSIDWVAFEREAELDRLHGPRLGPDRFALWEIERPARMAANLRANLGNGRPAGPYRWTEDFTFAELWAWHREDSPTCTDVRLQMGPPGYRCPGCGWQALTPDDP